MTDRTRVEIDLNDVDGNGLTKVLIADAGTLAVGQVVVAFESEDAVEAPATVESVNGVYAEIRVDWTLLRKQTSMWTLRAVSGRAPIASGRARGGFMPRPVAIPA